MNDKLQICFVSTEVAPWSKVGGLGDVMAALPAALAARGHQVMTVAPRYAEYKDAWDTGVSVPLELPPAACFSSPECRPEDDAGSMRAAGEEAGVLGNAWEAAADGQAAADGSLEAGAYEQAQSQSATGPEGQVPAVLSVRRARYFLCRAARVDRVFVEHPIYVNTSDIYGGNVNTYVEPGGFPDLDLRYSILCQAALAAPMLLWPGGAASAGRPDHAGHHSREGGAGASAAPAQTELGDAAASSSVSEALLAGSSGRGGQPGAGQAAIGLVFVGNDWPCAPLALRLKHSARAARQRQQQQLQQQRANNGGPAVPEAAPGAAGSMPEPAAAPAENTFASLERPQEAPAAAGMAAAAAAGEIPGEPQGAAGDEGFSARLAESLARARMAFAVHNLAYQGACSAEAFPRLCLPDSALPALQWPPAMPAAASKSSEPAAAGEVVQPAAASALPSRAAEELLAEAAGHAEVELAGGGSSAAVAPPCDAAARDAVGATEAGTGAEGPEQEQQPDGDDAAPPSLNWMHAALRESDLIVTVSPNYAEEICGDEGMACGMRDVLCAHGVSGIMNGLDTEDWNPATDALLPPGARFAGFADSARGKSNAKHALQQRTGLHPDTTIPLIAFVGRLSGQKGMDVLLSALPALLGDPPRLLAAHCKLMADGLRRCLADAPAEPARAGGAAAPAGRRARLQVAVLGTGEGWMEHATASLSSAFPGNAVGIPRFDEGMAHLLMAAADYVIVPSRFEPCGLVAQAAARYGALPIVTAVGGLANFVGPEVGYRIEPFGHSDAGPAQRRAVAALVAAVRGAVADYGTPRYRKLQRACLELDLSWAKPAEQWERALLQLARRREP